MRVLIFGNSGSGKTTLARKISRIHGVISLDLDTVAWKKDQPGVREELAVSIQKLGAFTSASDRWVVEGCYSDLIAHAALTASEMIFLNPGVEQCVLSCRSRPWEPHKYKTKVEQDKNLEILLDWVRTYESRADEFSLGAHQKIFESFSGKKQALKSNQEIGGLASGIRA